MSPLLERRRASELVLWFALAFVAMGGTACGASRPTSPAASPPGLPPAGAATRERKPWSEAMQTLRFDSLYGPFAPLWEGHYELVLAGQAYAAKCSFRISDLSDTKASHWGKETCIGDEVYLLWGVWSVMGITLPQRLSAVQVRLVRNRATLFDGKVSGVDSCAGFVADSEASGVCVFVEPKD
jgi:hypothetical protein